MSFKSQSPHFQFLSDEIILRSMMDFELALQADVFVGATHSTFANGLHSTRLALSEQRPSKHYDNCAAEELLPFGDSLFKHDDVFKNDPFYAAISVSHPYLGFDRDPAWIPVYVRAHVEYHYRARLADDTWTELAVAPSFVGTRGKGQELTGFAVPVAEKDRAKVRMHVIGEFTGHCGAVLVGDGEDCLPSLPGSALAGIQVILRRA
jgi:hypothetical protein